MSAEESDLDRLRSACEKLAEHFDTVQIFATRHEPEQEGGTVNVAFGNGNWFARYGFIHDWMIRQNERTRQGIRADL